MWHLETVVHEISQGAIHRRLAQARQEEVAAIPEDELTQSVAALLTRPPPGGIQHGRALSNLVYAAQYYEAFGILDLPEQLFIFEPCVGASDPIIIAADTYSNGQADYTTVNLNRPLRTELQAKISHVESSVHIIDDNAQRARTHLGPDSVNAVCFHHAINDILQTAVSEPRGMDTATVDWWPNERQMIEWMAEDAESGMIYQRGKPELMEIIANATTMTRPGGHLIFDHWGSLMYRDVDWFPWKLFCDLVPMTRRWIEESSLPLTEVMLTGADPQWWMFLQVGDGDPT